MVGKVRKKLPKVIPDDFSKIAKMIDVGGEEAFDELIDQIAKENPVVIGHIERTGTLISQTQNRKEALSNAVASLIILYSTLEMAMERMPELITKSDNDTLPTLSDKTAIACIEEHQRNSSLGDTVKKIEQARANMPGISTLFDFASKEITGIARATGMNDMQKALSLGSMLSFIYLTYNAFKSQAENNKLKKMFEDKNQDENPPE